MQISVLIPTWNEAPHLPRTVAAVRANPESHEILVIDGGSEDGTAGLADQLGCRVLAAGGRQRARQLNLGAASSSGECLLFLHADTLLPPTAFASIRSALARPGVVGGCFARRFESSSRFLWFTAGFADLRARRGWFLGDQAMFVRRDVFDHLGGFKESPLFEDLDFSRRLRRAGSTVCLRPPVRSSARRFVPLGPVRTTLVDVWLTLLFLCGVPPDRLAASASRWLRREPDRTVRSAAGS